MKYTKTLVGKEAREALKRGIDQVALPVGLTIGAAGRNAAYREFGMPVITNDGISVARGINPQDKFERIGADLIKQASEQTNSEAGDGTTGTVVVAHAVIEQGIEAVGKGMNPMELRRELDEAKVKAVSILKEISIPIKNDKDIFDIAKISVEDENVAQIVVDSVKDAGSKGAVIVEDSVGYTIEKEKLSGYFWEKGYVSPYMTTNERGEAVLENVPVIVTDKYLNLNRELVPVIDALMKHPNKYRACLVIADKVEGELLQTLIINRTQIAKDGSPVFITVAVCRPGSLEELEDIAAMTGATAVTKDKGIREIGLEHIGMVKKVVVRKNNTVIINDESKRVKERIAQVEEALKDDKDNELLKERIAKLAGGVVMLRVGAKTEAERKYLRLKIDDAVSACRSAIEEGTVNGGGVALTEIASKIVDLDTKGAKILREAMMKPYEKILENAGIKNDGNMYNVLTGKPVKDMRKAGIIDPTKVIRCEIENAVSLAGIFLTLESVTCEFEEEKKS